MTKLKSLPNFPPMKTHWIQHGDIGHPHETAEDTLYNKILSEVGELAIPDYSVPTLGEIEKLFDEEACHYVNKCKKELAEKIHNLITKRSN